MRNVQFTETVLRDGNQSLMATRLPYTEYEPILPVMDQAGYYSLECWGGATSCFSNGTSQPATETLFYALQQYGIETGLNEDAVNKVNEFFKPIKQKYLDNGILMPKSMATDAQALVYKIPGGMLSNMMANLKEMGALDRFEEALLEIPSVRKDLGYPPLVTPLSQMVGNQAVTNVLLGERYKQVSKEVKNYFKGEYGITPAPVSKEVQDRILGGGVEPVDCRVEDSKRTGEEFQAAKAALGDLCRCEEDVMSYICYPDQTITFLREQKNHAEHTVTYSITLADEPDAPAPPTATPVIPPSQAAAPVAVPVAGEPVNSPMPGKILNVNAAAGQAVKAGDVLVILEAMKMENEIVSPRDGIVRHILVQKGSTVDTGTSLLILS